MAALSDQHRTRSLPIMTLTPLQMSKGGEGDEEEEERIGSSTSPSSSPPHRSSKSERLPSKSLPPAAAAPNYADSDDRGVEDGVYLAAWKGPLTGAITDFTSTLAAGVRRRGTEERSGGDCWRSNSASHLDLAALLEKEYDEDDDEGDDKTRRHAAGHDDEDEESDEDEDDDDDDDEDAATPDGQLGLQFKVDRKTKNGLILDSDTVTSKDRRKKEHRPVIFHDLAETEENRRWDNHPAWNGSQEGVAGGGYFSHHGSPSSRSRSPLQARRRNASAYSLPSFAAQRLTYDDITYRSQPSTPGALYHLGPLSSSGLIGSSSSHPSPEYSFSTQLPMDAEEQLAHDREVERLRLALELSVARGGKMYHDPQQSMVAHAHAPGANTGSYPASRSNSRRHSRRGSSALYPSGSTTSLATLSQMPSVNSVSGRPAHKSAEEPSSLSPSTGRDESLGVWFIDVLHRLFEFPLALAGVDEVGMGRTEGLEDSEVAPH